MSATDGTKSAGKSGQRKGKGKGKVEQRKKAVSQEAVSKASLPDTPVRAQLQSPDQELQQPQPDHLESPKVDQQPAIEASVVEQPAVEEPVVAVAASPEPQPTAAPLPSELPPAAPVSAEPPPAEPVTAEPVLVEPVLAEPVLVEVSINRAVTGRACAGEPADHRKCLSRLHTEIDRGVRIVCRTAQRRPLARQGDDGSDRIREAGLRDLGGRVAEDLRTSQPARQADPRPVQGVDGQDADNARQVLKFETGLTPMCGSKRLWSTLLSGDSA